MPEAILISMGVGAWCAMMAVTPESRGLNSPRAGGSVGKLPVPRLKGFVVAAPLLPRHREQLFAMLMGTI